MKRGRDRAAVAVIAGVGLLAAASAAAVCHPDSPGTRTLEVRGDVVGYVQRGAGVDVTLRTADGCENMEFGGRSSASRLSRIRPKTTTCDKAQASRGYSVVVDDTPKRPLRATTVRGAPSLGSTASYACIAGRCR